MRGGATLALAAISLGCVACSPSTSSTSRSASTVLHVDVSDLPSQLAPDNPWFLASSTMWEPLYSYTPGLGYAPGLVDSLDHTQDDLTWTLHVRPDLKWSDGQPLDANDVAYSFHHAIDPRNGVSYASNLMLSVKGAAAAEDADPMLPASQIQGLVDATGIRVLNSTTVQIVLEHPEVDLEPFLASASLSPLPQHVVERTGTAKFGTSLASLVTSGPFLPASFDHNKGFTLKPNPHYFGPQPALKEIDVRVVSGADDANSDLRSGAAQMTDPFDPVFLGQSPDAYFSSPLWHSAASFDIQPIVFNAQSTTLRSADARRAFAGAINRQVIADVALSKDASAATAFFPVGTPGVSANVAVPSLSAAAAAAAFSAAGITPGTHIRLLYINQGAAAKVAAGVAHDIGATGLAVDVEAVAPSGVFSRLISGNYDAVIGMHTRPFYPSATSLLDVAWNLVAGAYGTWPPGDIGAAITTLQDTTDPATQPAQTQSVAQSILQSGAFSPLTVGKLGWMQSPRVTGLTIDSVALNLERVPFTGVSVH
ncbi:MAG: ABC transporter substrate-binding protein [Candidatus Dormibacteria bacterium]